MRRRIFLRILGLLALLIVVTGTAMSLFQISVHRQEQIRSGREKVLFLARQFESLLMWDDRVAMRKTLVHMVEDDEFARYAFLSVGLQVVAHSFPAGIPVGFVELSNPSLRKTGPLESDVFEFKEKSNGVVYDLTIPMAHHGAVLHLGLDQGAIDRAAVPSVLGIAAICGIFCLLLIYPALKESNAITREVDEMTDRLKEANLVLEERVAERTADLFGANQRLAEGREQLAVTLRSIGDGVITTDVDKNIRLLNRVGEELTGWTQKEAVGRPLNDIFQIVSRESNRRLDDPADAVLGSGNIVTRTGGTVLTAKDGRERSITLSCAPIRDMDSRIIGTVLVFHDVTEKERLDIEMQRSEKLESIGVLAGGIAHDFNNFLAAIQGNIELAALHTDADTPIYEYLKRADQATTKAGDLALRLLTFSKGNAPVKKAGDIESILRESAKLALSGARNRCVFTIQSDLPAVLVDAGQIGQVFHNLFLNADQAMPDGGEISVQCTHVFVEDAALPIPPGAYVRITVADHGVGIPEEALLKVFDPFFTTKKTGTGLGLAVVHSVVRNHGGTIEVDSKEGEGTTFTLYLPATGEAPDTEKNVPSPVAGGKGRVLVMDDEEMLCDLLRALLTKVGYDVVCAADGETTVELFNQAKENGEDFDLLILDLTIPGGVGGIETIRRIRAQGSAVKAIATSGYSSAPAIAEPEQYGFDTSVSKPYKIQDVCRIVQETLENAPDSAKQELLH